ncbi:MAG: hypothetical protein GF408_03715 [Candidatus Omnitrophica bacterium]|nr:hypothetical protein [Candidatus Omnitrophota bacterium]
MFQDRKICKRCVMPESKPDIRLNEEGVCNLCLEYEKNKGRQKKQRPPLESDLTALLKKYRTKGEYDCLVMCSGGKDSTAALYFMKKRYKLNPLAFTFDNGFETEEALENARSASEKLGADHLLFKTDKMKKMFADAVKRHPEVVLCHLCSIWYMDLTFRMAERFDIPVIVAGWTRGQSTERAGVAEYRYGKDRREFTGMGEATRRFLKEYTRENPGYRDFPKSIEEVIKKARKRHRTVEISPHWFLPYSEEEYTDLITKELGWKAPENSYPAKSTNCGLNFLSVYNSMKHYGYTHYHVEMSKMIRAGLMTRDEALESLAINFDKELLNFWAAKLGHRFEEI